MPVLQNLYQIYKLPSSMIVDNNFVIENYSKPQAMKDQNIVSIGDNMVFQAIRYYYHDNRGHREIFEDIQDLRSKLKECKKQGDIARAYVLNRRITDVLFVKDIINIKIEKKKHYKMFGIKGFSVNGIEYVYFCAGSGQIRRDTITFINKELLKPIGNALMCGFGEKVKDFNIAKFHAYFALAFSSVLWVRTPRVCVVKDFYNLLPDDEEVDFIEKDKDNPHKSIINRYTAKQLRQMGKAEFELNCADGQGLIDPSFAKIWSRDMNLSYTPCSFVVRSVFVKGNLATFDFKELARRNNIKIIYDKWNTPYDVNDIDVILSESQFKMHKYYKSWQEYTSYTTRNRIRWGVARYNKKYDDECVLANYQYIQSLNLSRDDIKGLIKPTIDWLQKVCSGDTLYSLLYTYGSKNDSVEYSGMFSSAQSLATKAIIKNVEFLQDSFVQAKIYKNITESINKAKLGKIWLKGNYSFMISDPYAQAQSALGLRPTGLLKSNEVYSSFWNNRGKPKVIDLCRSPMIDSHEHNPCNLVDSDEMSFWYQYLNSGIIFNIYDSSVYRMEDADFDGDICLSTDNEYFIKGSHKNEPIITYQKGSVATQKITPKNQMNTNIRGLGSGVGGYSNCAAIFFALRDIFKKDSDEYKEISLRIKLLREIVGQEIDRIKGVAKPELPHEWKKMLKILPTDSQEERQKKYKHNSMIIQNNKKPYYFRYRYPELNQRYKQYENTYNQQAKDMFGLKVKQLIKKVDKTEQQTMLVRRYQKNNPLITSNCNMNILCKELENVDFDIKYNNNKGNISKLPTFEALFSGRPLDKNKYNITKKCYQKYHSQKQIKMLDSLLYFSGYSTTDPLEENWDYNEVRISLLDIIREEIRQEVKDNSIEVEEFLYYCHLMSKEYSRFNWAFVWDILDIQIINYIPNGRSYAPVKVIDKTEGSKEYLGQYYMLKDITKDAPIVKLKETIDGGENENASVNVNCLSNEPLPEINNDDNDNDNVDNIDSNIIMSDDDNDSYHSYYENDNNNDNNNDRDGFSTSFGDFLKNFNFDE